MACPSSSLNGFPVTTTLTITDQLLASINEKFDMTTTWGIRYTIPNFVGSTSQLDEMIGSTTITYNSNKYSLLSVEFEKPSHTSWLSTANQPNNKEDIVFTFNYNSLSPPTGSVPQLIIIVIPIVRNASTSIASDPLYLQALGDPAKGGQALTLQSVIPETSYVYYNTCLNIQLTRNLALSQNMNFLVFLNTAGLSVSTGTMTRISDYYNRISSAGSTTNSSTSANVPYPPYTIPFLTLNSGITPYNVSSQLDLGLKIRSTVGIFDSEAPAAPPTNETTDAYKCVPLDPETQVQNGQLMVDPNTGTLLTSVLGDRQKEITATRSAPGTPGTVSFAFSSSIATIVGATLVVILIMIILTLSFGQFGIYLRTTVVRSSTVQFIFFGIVIFVIAFTLGNLTSTLSALAASASNALGDAKNSAITTANTAVADIKGVAASTMSKGVSAVVDAKKVAITAAQKAMASAAAAANPSLATDQAQVDAAKTAEADAVASTAAAKTSANAINPTMSALMGGSTAAVAASSIKAYEDAKLAERAAIDARVAVELASTQCAGTASTSAACASAKADATTRLQASASAAAKVLTTATSR